MKNIVAFKNLQVNLMTIHGIVYAVRGIDLNIYDGEIHGIVGESGCGKSMTIKSIMKLHEEKTTEYLGQIEYKGTDLVDASEQELQKIRGKEISMIFQDPMVSLNPIMKIGDQISEMICMKEKIKKKEAHSKVLQILESLGIQPAEKRYHQYPFEMSGGMLQRIMIAMAISCNPKLLIADEPTTALDVTIQAQILDVIKELQRKNKMTIIIVTHNLGVVAEICDRVSVMYAGKIVETGSVKEIFDCPGHPYTKALLGSNPKKGQKEMKSIPGSPPSLLKQFKGCAFYDRCIEKCEKCAKTQPDTYKISERHYVTCHLAVEGDENNARKIS